MGKVFITDEVNDMYTADVTNAGKLKVETGAGKFAAITSAHTLITAANPVTGAAYLKSIIFGDVPASATQITIYDTSMSASNVSGFGFDSAQLVAAFGFEPTAGALSADRLTFPKSIPIDVYCASGITVAVGHSACDSAGRIGAMRNIFITYQQ